MYQNTDLSDFEISVKLFFFQIEISLVIDVLFNYQKLIKNNNKKHIVVFQMIYFNNLHESGVKHHYPILSIIYSA